MAPTLRLPQQLGTHLPCMVGPCGPAPHTVPDEPISASGSSVDGFAKDRQSEPPLRGNSLRDMNLVTCRRWVARTLISVAVFLTAVVALQFSVLLQLERTRASVDFFLRNHVQDYAGITVRREFLKGVILSGVVRDEATRDRLKSQIRPIGGHCVFDIRCQSVLSNANDPVLRPSEE